MTDHAGSAVMGQIEVGVAFGPTGRWDDVVAGARLAEQEGLDAVGFWDHYHSENPDWALTCGWAAYGYLAAITERVRLVPMVLCRPNYLLGVLAKESSILQIASGGRFELGIGAGDYPGNSPPGACPMPRRRSGWRCWRKPSPPSARSGAAGW
jgi:alkanesulfonate monooxygenase SsuD/methylene tetrahydromethanopterin reductase-like flavin-dependent oxidoreductase (luciferase family)